MNKIQDILKKTTQKYSRYVSLASANMRLILLIVFGILCGYLVVQVNNLVSDKKATSNSDTSDVSSKKPDASVLSVFNELQSQNIEVNSQFDSQRNNPF
jgi:hypothetical protein